MLSVALSACGVATKNRVPVLFLCSATCWVMVRCDACERDFSSQWHLIWVLVGNVYNDSLGCCSVGGSNVDFLKTKSLRFTICPQRGRSIDSRC